VVVENRPGGGAVLASELAARAPADGYTWMHVDNGILVYNPALYARLPYDPDKDFQGVGFIGRFPLFIVVRPDNPVKDFAGLLARSKVQAPNYGTPAVASPHHLAMEMVKRRTGLAATHVPYRGGPAAMQDLLAGNVDMMFDGLGSSAAHIKGGRIKALMVSGTKRNPAFPDVPCSSEVGLPDYTVSTWYGLWAPKGTPADAQARMIEEVRKACQSDDAKAVWASQGAEFPNLTGAQFDAFIKTELRKWSQVVKASGAKLD
jgi:tripartite-type tricarboxylate transporter receptor subunit TctC